MPNKTVVRSVLASKNGKIYAGCSNNFGFFSHEKNKGLKFNSLKYLIPEEDRNFEDIWKIYQTDFGIIFQSYKLLIIVKNNTAQTFKAPSAFRFSFFVKNKLYIIDEKEGLLLFENYIFTKVRNTEKISKYEISSIIPDKKGILICTIN